MFTIGYESSLVYWVSSFYITGFATVASMIVSALLIALPYRRKFGRPTNKAST